MQTMHTIYEEQINGHTLRVMTDDTYVYVPYLHEPLAPPFRLQIGVPNYDKQVFTYTPQDTGVDTHYDIEKLHQMTKAHPERYKLVDQYIYPQNVQHVVENNGIEKEHLQRLVRNPARLMEPGILMTWPNGQATIIDGNHRFVVRHRLGMETMPLWLMTVDDCKPAMLLMPPLGVGLRIA